MKELRRRKLTREQLRQFCARFVLDLSLTFAREGVHVAVEQYGPEGIVNHLTHEEYFDRLNSRPCLRGPVRPSSGLDVS